MVRHIVLFRFRPDVNETDRKKAAADFRSGILALKGVIPEILHIEVGININPVEKWHICLHGEFSTLDDVISYSRKPEHIKVASALKPFIEDRACVDYSV